MLIRSRQHGQRRSPVPDVQMLQHFLQGAGLGAREAGSNVRQLAGVVEVCTELSIHLQASDRGSSAICCSCTLKSCHGGGLGMLDQKPKSGLAGDTGLLGKTIEGLPGSLLL